MVKPYGVRRSSATSNGMRQNHTGLDMRQMYRRINQRFLKSLSSPVSPATRRLPPGRPSFVPWGSACRGRGRTGPGTGPCPAGRTRRQGPRRAGYRSARTPGAQAVEACKTALVKKKANLLDANFIEGMACMGGCINGAGCLTHGEKNRAKVDKFGEKANPKTITQAINDLNK